MCPAISLPMFDAWNADAFSAASFALKVSAAFKNRANALTLAARLWKLDGVLADLLNKIYSAIKVAKPATRPTEQSIRSALSALRTICEANETIYLAAKSTGLTNGRFTGTALNSIRVRTDEILDLVEAIEIAMDDPNVDGIFEKSLAELERGETISMSAL
jgi:hypothetical protein